MSNGAFLRDQFPILRNKTYLNTCSYGALCLEVSEALEAYMAVRNTHGADWPGWIAKLGEIRASLGKLMSAPPEDFALASSLSDSVNALASSLSFEGKRRKVIITEYDFPTTAQIWRAQARHGAEIVIVPARDGRLSAEDLSAHIDDDTLLVSIPSVCYWNGARLDVEAIVELAHRRGALVLIDVFQSLGTYPFDASASGADFIAGGCTKYLIGGSGVGFLYVRDSAASALSPTRTGWFAQRDPSAMDVYAHDPAPDARRFESGTPAVASLYAAEAGLNVLLRLDQAAVWAHLRDLSNHIIEEAGRLGCPVATPADHGALVALKVGDDAQLVERLALDGVVLTSRAGNLRVSPHFYNNHTDIEALFLALRRHRTLVAN